MSTHDKSETPWDFHFGWRGQTKASMRFIPLVFVTVLYFVGPVACSSTVHRRCFFATKGGAQCISVGPRTSAGAQPDASVDADEGAGRNGPE